MSVRIIPRLDIKGPNLVKGIHFEGLRVLGKPETFAKYYYENGADELFFMDAVASLYERNSLIDIIEKTSKEIFIPLTVGGGLRSIDDIRTVLRAGADKVALNTAVINRPELIREASRIFGSSTIMIHIDAIKNENGFYEAYTDYGRVETGVDVFEWIQRVYKLGAGEIMITSIEKEGTGKGFDVELTRKVSEMVDIPVIASGGCGKIQHIHEIIKEGLADAVSMASVLHYNSLKYFNYNDHDFKIEGNIEFLKKQTKLTKIQGASIGEIKKYLTDCGLECHYEQ